MVSSVTSATQVEPTAVQATSAKSARSTRPAPNPHGPSATTVQDSVTISSGAVAKLALQEATETQFQTAQEAGRGDMQARRLLAKEQAAAKTTEH